MSYYATSRRYPSRSYATTLSSARVITAKFPGTCNLCGAWDIPWSSKFG